MIRILLVARDDPDRAAVADAVRASGGRVSLADSAAAAIADLSKNRPDIVFADLAAGNDALRLVRAAVSLLTPVPVVALADRRRPEASAEALRLGAIDIVARPIRAADVNAALANASEFRELAARIDPEEPEPPGDELMVLSLGLRRVLESVRHLARSRCNVLIVGERGSGREILARAIHAQGPAAREPVVTIDCSYVAAQASSTDDVARFEKELLDAIVQPQGDAARGHRAHGAVLLKNLGDLPLGLQGTLERLLAERDGARGGGALPRMLASAHPSISEAVERRMFRRDLLERLAVVRLDLPPLRQRPQDVPLLASLFLKEACGRHSLPPKTFSPSARALLGALPWRANVSELRLLAERLALIIPGGVVQQEHVLAQVRFDGAETRGHAEGTLREARERFERDYIASVLQHHRWRMGAAAKQLGIERTNLYRKIKQLRIRSE